MNGQTRPPIINAPLPLTVFAVALIGLHGARVFLPDSVQSLVFYHGALFPERFWGWVSGHVVTVGGTAPYHGVLEAIAPLFLSTLLHGDWVHVGLNAAFLIAFGKPVLEMITIILGQNRLRAVIAFLVLMFVSQAGGAIIYLLLNNPEGPLAVGSSGGISGLLAALLLMREGARARIFSRSFLTVTVIFTVANILFAIVGPSLLGASIAWEVHIGGYIAGAIQCRALIWNAVRRPDM